MASNTKLKTYDIAMLAIDKYGYYIEKSCKEKGCHKSWNVMKAYIKMAIIEKYSKRTLNSLSAQFLGYAAHYIFAHYVNQYGR